MSEHFLTHKDLAAMLGVSETTVKSYRRKFPGCIPVANQGKPIRFQKEAGQVALRIRDLFETGMSVQEVRSRLAREFSWIAEDADTPGPARAKSGLGPEISVGVSNMAKSMVAMTQQQAAILKRMQGIEGMLEELGLQGMPDVDALRKERSRAARESEARIEQRLDQLDSVTTGLSESVQLLACKLEQLLGKRTQAAENWQHSGAEVMAEAAATASAMTRDEPAGARIYAFPGNREEAAQSAPVPEAGAAAPPEPVRQFYSLPLMVRTPQGQYASAGGRGRGRFSLNDLKAMLVAGFMPPEHYVLSWEKYGEGWWLHLQQPQKEQSQALHLLLMELPTQHGGNVVEILQVKTGDASLHPVEIFGIIDSLSA